MQQRVAAVHALCPPPKHHCNGMKIARRIKQKDAFFSNIFPMLVTVQLRSFSTFWVLGLISQGREKRKVTNCQCLLPPMKVSSTVFVLCTSVHQDARKNPSQSTKFCWTSPQHHQSFSSGNDGNDASGLFRFLHHVPSNTSNSARKVLVTIMAWRTLGFHICNSVRSPQV